jgi:hypothetical protein
VFSTSRVRSSCAATVVLSSAIGVPSNVQILMPTPYRVGAKGAKPQR